MSAGRVFIAAAASAILVGIIFALLVVFPIPPLGRAFVLAGYPLGHFILEFAPEVFIRALAPHGGPDAVGWSIALGTFLTWFALIFGVWLAVLWARRWA
jgi:xanthosine utilization system XapX-like protein